MEGKTFRAFVDQLDKHLAADWNDHVSVIEAINFLKRDLWFFILLIFAFFIAKRTMHFYITNALLNVERFKEGNYLER